MGDKAINKKKLTNLFNNFNPYSSYILFGVLLLFVPSLTRIGLDNSAILTIGSILIYAIVALGLNLLLGYSGLVSLGTAGFMGLSSYFTSFLTEEYNISFFISLFISILFPLLLGIVVGLISLRIEGYYLAIATLAVAEILKRIFEKFYPFTGGTMGRTANYPHLFNLIQLDRITTYYLICVILVIVMILLNNLINSATGRALLTMRGSNAAAQAMGIDIVKYRLFAFALSTIYASLAGVLYVHFNELTYPTIWSLNLSLNILAVIVIGGLRSISGTILGAFVVYGLNDLVIKQIPVISDIYGLSNIIFGFLIIIMIIYYPSGLINLLKTLFIKIKTKFNKKGVKASE